MCDYKEIEKNLAQSWKIWDGFSEEVIFEFALEMEHKAGKDHWELAPGMDQRQHSRGCGEWRRMALEREARGKNLTHHLEGSRTFS